MKGPPSPRVLVSIAIGSFVLAGLFLVGFIVLRSAGDSDWSLSLLVLTLTFTEIAAYAVYYRWSSNFGNQKAKDSEANRPRKDLLTK
jgi:hypothetical protein